MLTVIRVRTADAFTALFLLLEYAEPCAENDDSDHGNYNYIYHINVSRQQLILSDNATFTYTLSASKEALKKLKEYVEEKHKIN